VLVDYDVFENLSPPGPDPRTIYDPEEFDFRLRPGAAAVDRGLILPGINDGFVGAGPDLGAWELGREIPGYGPRF